MTHTQSTENVFLSGSVPKLFLKTALPIIMVMAINGLFTIVDAYFLGVYVGADALTAVTLMFPVYMLLVALSTLVSNGFSSVFARALGRGNDDEPSLIFTQAIFLSIVVSVALIVLFWIIGTQLTLLMSNGSQALAGMGYTYISILIFFSPLVFILAINLDALRCEGLITAMTVITVSSAVLNIVFDYIFIAKFGWGVAGSAYGTVLSQLCSLSAVFVYRFHAGASKKLFRMVANYSYWKEFLILGIPSSLGYLGLSLSAALTLYCLQIWAQNTYEATAGAFGIATRLMTFAFLPLLGLSMAFQTIVGNNFGAKQYERSNQAIKMALFLAFIYCLLVQISFIAARNVLGSFFVDDAAIQSELSRILPFIVALMFLFGPLMMIGTYFQSIGDGMRAALLGLSRTYLFALPLTFLLPFMFGETGIWLAGIFAECFVLILTIIVLRLRRESHGHRMGLFEVAAQ